LMVTSMGFGKRTPLDEYRAQGRGGMGLITQKKTDRTGHVIGTHVVTDANDVMIITDKGQVIRTNCKEISVLGRNTQGVKVIGLNEGETASSVALVAEDG